MGYKFIPPIYGDLGGGLLLFYQHYGRFAPINSGYTCF